MSSRREQGQRVGPFLAVLVPMLSVLCIDDVWYVLANFVGWRGLHHFGFRMLVFCLRCPAQYNSHRTVSRPVLLRNALESTRCGSGRETVQEQRWHDCNWNPGKTQLYTKKRKRDKISKRSWDKMKNAFGTKKTSIPKKHGDKNKNETLDRTKGFLCVIFFRHREVRAQTQGGGSEGWGPTCTTRV